MASRKKQGSYENSIRTCPTCSCELVRVGKFHVCPDHGVDSTANSSKISGRWVSDKNKDEWCYPSLSERPFRLLIADDHQVICVGLKIALTDGLARIGIPQECYVIDTCHNAEQAMKMLEKHDYDFIMTDIRMPGTDGITLMKQVRERYPRVWFGVLTSYADSETMFKAYEQGPLFYLLKEIDGDELSSVIRPIISLRCLATRMNDCILPTAYEEEILNFMPNLVRQIARTRMVRRVGPSDFIPPHHLGIDTQLFPYIMGGLIHNATNSLLGLQPLVAQRKTLLKEEESVSIHSAIENLKVLLRLMQEVARGFYVQAQGDKSGRDQLAKVCEMARLVNPALKCDIEIAPSFEQVPLPLGVSSFIVGELIKNSIKACAAVREPDISLKIGVDCAENIVSIECVDNGIGFSAEMLAKVRGQQLRPPNEHKAGGYGLYLIQELAGRLQGSVLVSNLQPMGARVQVLMSTKFKER